MANSKISALTAATTPVAGTETLPIVQGGVTKQVSIANLTAGRAVSAASLTLTTALTVGNGGTGTSTTFTAGSVVFAGASGVYSQNNSQFFWDNSNVRLGIGIGSPVWALDVRGPAGLGINFLENTSGNTNRVQLGADGAGLGYIDVNAGVGSIALGLFVGGSKKFTVDSNGNLIPAGASKGINFTANSALAGMTSQLLNWYEAGTYTPTITASSGTLTTVSASGNYTRIGRQITVNISITLTNIGTASGALIATLPYTCGLFPAIGAGREDQNTGNMLQARIPSGVPGSAYILTYNNTTVIATGNVAQVTITYFV